MRVSYLTRLKQARAIIDGIIKASIVNSPEGKKELKELENYENSIPVIVSIVCNHLKVSHAEFYNGSRKAPIVKARNLACYLIKWHTNLSYTYVGDFLGLSPDTVKNCYFRGQAYFSMENKIYSDLQSQITNELILCKH